MAYTAGTEPGGPEPPGYEPQPHLRFIKVYGLAVGLVMTILGFVVACGIDTKPDTHNMPGIPGIPSDFPTELPSDLPSSFPSNFPTDFPTDFPTGPTDLPTSGPTDLPTGFPTDFPTDLPTPGSDGGTATGIPEIPQQTQLPEFPSQ